MLVLINNIRVLGCACIPACLQLKQRRTVMQMTDSQKQVAMNYLRRLLGDRLDDYLNYKRECFRLGLPN